MARPTKRHFRAITDRTPTRPIWRLSNDTSPARDVPLSGLSFVPSFHHKIQVGRFCPLYWAYSKRLWSPPVRKATLRSARWVNRCLQRTEAKMHFDLLFVSIPTRQRFD